MSGERYRLTWASSFTCKSQYFMGIYVIINFLYFPYENLFLQYAKHILNDSYHFLDIWKSKGVTPKNLYFLCLILIAIFFLITYEIIFLHFSNSYGFWDKKSQTEQKMEQLFYFMSDLYGFFPLNSWKTFCLYSNRFVVTLIIFEL